MELRACGNSGLYLSQLSLGTMLWGRDTEAHEATDMLRTFVDEGGTTVDIATWHGDGVALSVLASALRTVGRHNTTLVVRGGYRRGLSPAVGNGHGRGAQLASIDHVLESLGTSSIDLWLATPDPAVPLEETLRALDTIIASGRAHYVGLDHASIWDAAQAKYAGDRGVHSALTALQMEYHLFNHAVQKALVERAGAEGIGVIAHSPLAGGVLTGKYRHATPPDSRAASEHLHHTVAPYLERSTGIVEALARAAEGLDASIAAVALAWVCSQPFVTSALIGPRTTRQLEQLLTTRLHLPPAISEVLTEVAVSA